MPKINETPEQFFDIVIIFLYDMMINGDTSVLNREDITDMIDMFKKKGLKSRFMKHYMSSSSARRVEYRRIKEVFYNPESSMMTVNILPDDNINEGVEIDEEFYRLKDQVKQVINIMKKQKYKSPGRIVSNIQIDKIINHVLKENK